MILANISVRPEAVLTQEGRIRLPFVLSAKDMKPYSSKWGQRNTFWMSRSE